MKVRDLRIVENFDGVMFKAAGDNGLSKICRLCKFVKEIMDSGTD
jgi:hypothetical protein